MLIALALAHFSSELLLKEQMIIPVKKTLNSAGHIDAKLINFSEICQKKSSEIGCFLLIVSWWSFPLKFPVKLADFSKNLPLKILGNLTFFPRNRPIFLRICLWKSREILLFFREISEALPWRVIDLTLIGIIYMQNKIFCSWPHLIERKIEVITYVPPSKKLQTLSSLLETIWNVSLMIWCCMSSDWKEVQLKSVILLYDAHYFSPKLVSKFGRCITLFTQISTTPD